MRLRSSLLTAMSAAALVGGAATVAPDPPAVSRGDRIAATCVTCHHPGNAHIPPLANVSAALLAAQAETGNTVMHRLVEGLTEDDLHAVAESLARSHGDAP